jgi:hypothetical protein
MINRFKFFSDNDEEEIPEGYINLEGEDIASWMWYHLQQSDYQNYEFITVHTNGIIEFLSSFHPQMIIPVYSIIGPNNTVHMGREDDPVGWGFNIQSDPLSITYLRYRG